MAEVEPTSMERMTFNGRLVAHYMIQTTFGDLHIVQHEAPGMEVIDDYLGWSNDKAERAFKAIATKVVNGKA